jgi:DNA-directed RNA polymerase subunit RPC12/RpoP
MGLYQCFHCGRNAVIWDSDFTGDDAFANGDENGVVHFCHCTHCGAEIQYYIKGNKED